MLLSWLVLDLFLSNKSSKVSSSISKNNWRVHCVKSVQIRSFFWSVFSPNVGKYGPEKNSVFGHFSRSGIFANFANAIISSFIEKHYVRRQYLKVSI